jgi:exopolyphosphatase/guanosine-5'-triphosphate,3'-diphosphate pyrophosphatase
VREETGLVLEIVDQETEAHLAAAGSAQLLDPACRAAVIFDIGGGSCELIWVEIDGGVKGARPGYRVHAWTSLPVGVVNLAERFGGVTVSAADYAAMVDLTTGHLMPFAELCREVAPPPEAMHLLGTSGTVTTITGIQLGLARYDRFKVDGQWLTRAEAAAVTRRLLAMDYAARARSPCVGPERADLVLAGCAILEAIMGAWPCERLRVADRGLREGILSQLMAEDENPRPQPRQRQGAGS